MKTLAPLLTCLLMLALSCPATADESQAQREEMVAGQIQARGVSDPRVLAAMRRVPRHRFVPPSLKDEAYEDRPLPIGWGQTISQPYVVAFMTEALRLQGGEKVLEIGTGSGYQAAVLAETGCRVFSLEIIPELAATASLRLKELGYSGVHAKTADGYYGWPEEAPFDAIIVTCAAGHLPPPLIKQLKPGGRMIIPVGPAMFIQDLVLVGKDAQGRVTTRSLMAVRFVPLVREP